VRWLVYWSAELVSLELARHYAPGLSLVVVLVGVGVGIWLFQTGRMEKRQPRDPL